MRTPLYFNYSGARRDLLDRAIDSYQSHADHLIDIRVNYSVQPRHFSKCLNEILRAVGTEKKFFFAHYDSEIESCLPIETMLKDNSNSAILSWTLVTDLLMLVDTDKVKSVGGWDELFCNSYMELDLINRLAQEGMPLKVINDTIHHGNGLLHNDASVLRSKVQAENIAKVYSETFLKDALNYYTRYGQGIKDPAYLALIEHSNIHFPKD